jgi:hypothetical protein
MSRSGLFNTVAVNKFDAAINLTSRKLPSQLPEPARANGWFYQYDRFRDFPTAVGSDHPNLLPEIFAILDLLLLPEGFRC